MSTPSRPTPAPRVLILGGTGFVGRHLCDAFRQDGYQIVCAARRQPAAATADRVIELDLLAGPVTGLAATIGELRCDLVVNAVGSIWGRTDAEMWTATAAPVLRLLDALALLPHRPALIHLGSVLEYGPAKPGVPLGRGTPAEPVTAYGKAKLAATEAVLARTRAGELDATVLRIANVAGPGSPAISLLGQVAARLRSAAAIGAGPAVVELDPLLAHRDFVDVRDVAAAVVAAARVRPTGVVLDIGRGEAVSVRELVRLLVEVSGVDARIIEREPAGGPAPADWIELDTGPARDRLGWRPTHSLHESVQAFWADVAGARAPA